MKNLAIIFLVLVGTITASAQGRYFDERYVYTQSHLYPVLINPGAIGASGDHELIFNYRNNWASFEGAPKSLTFSYNGELGNRLGFGAMLFRDQYASIETTKGQIGFSYMIESLTNKVGFGLTTEYIQNRLSSDLTEVNLNDPIILNAIDGEQYFDISFGVKGLYNETISYGIAFPGLVSSRVSNSTNSDEDEKEFGFILHAGYDYHSIANGMHIIPSIFVKQLRNVPTHVDFNVRFSFLEERLTSGVSYTAGADNRLGFLIGTKIDKAGFYYSYNISNNEFQDYNNGAHEISIAVSLSNKSAKDKAMGK